MSHCRNFVIVLSAFLGSMLIAPMCHADWQYTKWGMDEAQVQAAANGKAVAVSPEERKGQSSENKEARLKAPYQSGDLVFTAYFQFDRASGKLAAVDLKMLDPSKAPDLVGALTTKYGSPVDEIKNTVLRAWIWRPGDDQISVLQIGADHVSLTYQPRLTEQNEGL